MAKKRKTRYSGWWTNQTGGLPHWAGVLVVSVVVIVGVVALIGRPQTEPATRPVALVIGDSQANGADIVEPVETWVGQGLVQAGFVPEIRGYGGTGFLKARPADAGNPGHPGILDSLGQSLYELPTEVDLVVLEAGGNDNEYPIREVEAAANATVDHLTGLYPDAQIVAVGPLVQVEAGAEKRTEISDMLARVAANRGLSFIGTATWVDDHTLGVYLVDDRHFSADGHEQVAQIFRNALAEAGLTR